MCFNFNKTYYKIKGTSEMYYIVQLKLNFRPTTQNFRPTTQNSKKFSNFCRNYIYVYIRICLNYLAFPTKNKVGIKNIF
jgi:hypothetical protein